MSTFDCGEARERLPELASGRLGAEAAVEVEAHLETCGECRAEFELVRLLHGSTPVAPAGLDARVVAALRARRTTVRRPWWGVSAAAVAALALGIGISSQPGPIVETDVPAYAFEAEEESLWSSDDGLLAGAPSLDGLSDEALHQLLDELAVGSAGGAA